MTKYAYIAGPMSGKEEFNFPAFFAAEERLVADGWTVFNPAREDLNEWGTLENVRKNSNYRTCLRKDVLFLIDTPDVHIFLLPGWEFSKGVAVEVALGQALNLTIKELEDD